MTPLKLVDKAGVEDKPKAVKSTLSPQSMVIGSGDMVTVHWECALKLTAIKLIVTAKYFKIVFIVRYYRCV